MRRISLKKELADKTQHGALNKILWQLPSYGSKSYTMVNN
jgi:hypothetical protein